MRFVTFLRGGRRTLGALLDLQVVDLPALVGHPAFPSTAEALVRRNGGTVLHAAAAALAREDAPEFVVADAHLVVPVVPGSLRSPDAPVAERPLVGPDADLAFPAGAGALEVRPGLAAVLRRDLDGVGHGDVPDAVFGFLLLADWRVVGPDGALAPAGAAPIALGPWIATPDDFDPTTAIVRVTVDGEERLARPLNGAASRLLRDVAGASTLQPLAAGDAFASTLAPGGERVAPGASVEVSIDGLGALRAAVG
ncbi:MAG: fumarylacetoacetate hydrolase family protein, partial [Actinomycetota bacterium]